MDTLYSLSLLISLIVGGVGALIFVLLLIWPKYKQQLGARVTLVPLFCGVTALLFGLISVCVHFIFGHGPESADTMVASRFLRHHKAYWFVLVFTLLSYSAWRLASRHPLN